MPRKSKAAGSKREASNEPVDQTEYQASKLPAHLEEQRTRVTLENQAPRHVSVPDYHGVYDSLGFDNSFNFEEFQNNFRLEVTSLTEESIVFEVFGIDAPVANALRRILISEVPTMAIEQVFIENNTSILPDEVLAHRLGLIPIFADPRRFDMRTDPNSMTDTDTIMFTLNVKCTRIAGSSENDPEEKKYEQSRITSGDLVWMPQYEQRVAFEDNPIRPVYLDIPIAKLRPGQSISLTCYCEKNIGKEHAKWSPVATATYRLMPDITFKQPVEGDLAQELVKKCPMSVFDIEDSGKALVKNPKNCTMCRECIREPEWNNRVKLQKHKQHFIFSVESVGIIPPEVIVEEALKTLLARIQNLKTAFAELKYSQSGSGGVQNTATELDMETS